MVAVSLPRSPLALILDRNFGPYFVGNLASNIGTWFQQITAAVVMFEITGSALMVGMVGVSQFLPSLVLAPWTGAAADRFDRRRLLMSVQTVAAVTAALLALLTAVVGLEVFPAAWPLLAASLVIGLVNAMSVPAQQALVPALVPSRDLDGAVALNSVTYNLARAIGPAVGAAVLVTWGAAAAFGVNALSFLVLVTALLVVRSRPLPPPRRSSVWVGFQHVRTDPTLAVLLVGLTALGFGIDPVLTLTPALAQQYANTTFTDPEALVGLLISAFGAGAMVATLAIGWARARWDHIPMATTGLVLLCLGTASLGLAPTAWIALGGLVVAGAGYLVGVTSLTSAMHLRTPEHLRGRIMALWGVAFLGSRPVAALLDGAIADLTSPQTATLVAAGVVAICGLVLARFVPAPPPMTS